MNIDKDNNPTDGRGEWKQFYAVPVVGFTVFHVQPAYQLAQSLFSLKSASDFDANQLSFANK